MINIFEFFDKFAICINSCTNLGKVEFLLFSNRLKQVFYLKTSGGFYIKFSDILCVKDSIIVEKIFSNIEGDFISINSCPFITKTNGENIEKINSFLVDKRGVLQEFYINNTSYNFKDIFNANNNTIIMQSEKYKRPLNKCKNNAKNNNNNKNKGKNFAKCDKKNNNVDKTFLKDKSCDICNTDSEQIEKLNNITIMYPIKNKQLKLNDVVKNCNAKLYKPTCKFIIHYKTMIKSNKMPKKIVCNCNLLLGKHTNCDIITDDGDIIIPKNSVITTNYIKVASNYNKLADIAVKS